MAVVDEAAADNGFLDLAFEGRAIQGELLDLEWKGGTAGVRGFFWVEEDEVGVGAFLEVEDVGWAWARIFCGGRPGGYFWSEGRGGSGGGGFSRAWASSARLM